MDRPFARPGDWVEISHSEQADPTFPNTPEDLVILLIFKGGMAPGSAGKTLILSSRDALDCTYSCNPICQLGHPIQILDDRRLRFAFPDTDSSRGEPNDDVTVTGPVRLVVTQHDKVDPCGSLQVSCDDSGLACIDGLFTVEADGPPPVDDTFPSFTALPPPNDYEALCQGPACRGTETTIRFALDAMGNILMPMDWRGVLFDRDEIPVARQVRAKLGDEIADKLPFGIPHRSVLASYSPTGLRLPPVFEPQATLTGEGGTGVTLFGTVDAPETVLRIARHFVTKDVCSVSDGECEEVCPTGNCTCLVRGQDGREATETACKIGSDCGSEECGLTLFSLEVDRLPAGDDLEARDPVSLDGLIQSTAANAFVLEEALVGKDLNGDGDMTDPVVTMGRRSTGENLSIGRGGSGARAIARVKTGRHSFPALSVEDDILAFLEPEPLEGRSPETVDDVYDQDKNEDDDLLDTILRAFRLPGSSDPEETIDDVSPTLSGMPTAADAAPLVNGRSVVVSESRIFFRVSEAANAARRRTRITEGADNNSRRARLSEDGRVVAFVTDATNLDQSQEAQGVAVAEVEASNTSSDAPTQGVAGDVHIVAPTDLLRPATLSDDGRFLAFTSDDLAQGQPSHVYWVDRDLLRHVEAPDCLHRDDALLLTESGTSTGCVEVTSGVEGNSGTAVISGDGRFIAFRSLAESFGSRDDVQDPPEPDPDPDEDSHKDARGAQVYRYDRANAEIELVSLDENGELPSSNDRRNTLTGGCLDISTDGRFVVFDTTAPLVEADEVTDAGDSRRDVYLRDVVAQRTELISVSSTEKKGSGFCPGISGDGRFVAFASFASNLVPGDTNGSIDVFVRDRELETTSRVSVRSDGGQAAKTSFDPSKVRPVVSRSGRYVSFEAAHDAGLAAPELNQPSIFVHDRLTSMLWRATDASGGLSDLRNGGIVGTAPSLAFASQSHGLSGGGMEGCVGFENCTHVYLYDVADDPAFDLNGDGDLDDVVLQVVEPMQTPMTLGAAGKVVVSRGRAAFLQPQ